MHRPALVSVLAALALACSTRSPDGSEPQLRAVVPEEVARLLPSRASFVLRLESLEEIARLGNDLQLAQGGTPITAADVLAGLALPGDPSQIDNRQPLYLATVFAAGMSAPEPTFVLPVRDAGAYTGSLAGTAWNTAVLGAYVGVTESNGYAAASKGPPLAGGLRPGLVSLRVDLAALIRDFRPLFEVARDQLERELGSAPGQDGSPLDLQPLVDLYLDLAEDFLDSAEVLGATLQRSDGLLELACSLSTRAGSPLSGWGDARPAELGTWPAALDPEAALVVLAAGDWKAFRKHIEPFADASFAAYPAATRQVLERIDLAWEPIYEDLGATVMTVDFPPGGARMGSVSRCRRAAQAVEAWRAAVEEVAQEESTAWLRLRAPSSLDLAGEQALRFEMELEEEFLAASIADAGTEEAREALAQGIPEALFENGLTVTMVPLEEELIVTMGGDDSYVAGLIAPEQRSDRPLPLDLRHALAAVEGGGPCLLYRYDFGRTLQQLAALSPALGGKALGLGALPNGPLAVTAWISIHGADWRFGGSVHIDQIAALLPR